MTRYSIITNNFCYYPEGVFRRVGNLAKLAKEISAMRFSRETQVGMRTDQHLSRVRLELRAPSKMIARAS